MVLVQRERKMGVDHNTERKTIRMMTVSIILLPLNIRG